jgi:catechol 2,3-dioxygenase-like lactoylglutathione lyase family enzyme
MKILSLLHSSLLVEDLARAREFYEGMLGLAPSPARPAMSFDGVWYDLGQQQIHLLCLPNPEKGLVRPEHGGRDRHVALGVDSIAELSRRLDAAGISYTRSQSGRAALFCRDPDQNALEFVEASNEGPA